MGDYFAYRRLTPYCMSRLIWFLRGCFRFYIYLKCPKINTFQKGRCTHAWVAIVIFCTPPIIFLIVLCILAFRLPVHIHFEDTLNYTDCIQLRKRDKEWNEWCKASQEFFCTKYSIRISVGVTKHQKAESFAEVLDTSAKDSGRIRNTPKTVGKSFSLVLSKLIAYWK